jgi:hypothetical protein
MYKTIANAPQLWVALAWTTDAPARRAFLQQTEHMTLAIGCVPSPTTATYHHHHHHHSMLHKSNIFHPDPLFFWSFEPLHSLTRILWSLNFGPFSESTFVRDPPPTHRSSTSPTALFAIKLHARR